MGRNAYHTTAQQLLPVSASTTAATANERIITEPRSSQFILRAVSKAAFAAPAVPAAAATAPIDAIPTAAGGGAVGAAAISSSGLPDDRHTAMLIRSPLRAH